MSDTESESEPDPTTNDDTTVTASTDERPPSQDENATDETAPGDGRLSVVGLGPGSPEGMTARARETLWLAEELVGYDTYVDLLPDPLIADAEAVHATGMGEEVARVEDSYTGRFLKDLLNSGTPLLLQLFAYPCVCLLEGEVDCPCQRVGCGCFHDVPPLVLNSYSGRPFEPARLSV